MRANQSGAISPRLIVGLFVIALGVLFTLDNLNLAHAEHYVRFWPAVLVAIGVAKLLDTSRSSGRVGAVIFILIGGLLLLDEIPSLGIDIDPRDLWPLVLLIIGGRLVWSALGYGRRRRGTAASDDTATVNGFAMMAGNGLTNTSQEFRGGDLTAIMGGVGLDLRGATMAGPEVEIEVFAMWGGIEIHVPETWAVTSKVIPLLGGFEDNTRPPLVADAPRLIVKGVVLMGGIEVNNSSDEERTLERASS